MKQREIRFKSDELNLYGELYMPDSKEQIAATPQRFRSIGTIRDASFPQSVEDWIGGWAETARIKREVHAYLPKRAAMRSPISLVPTFFAPSVMISYVR